MRWAWILLCLPPMACTQAPPVEPEAKEPMLWTGHYSYGGHPYSARLHLGLDGRFSFLSQNNQTVLELLEGNWLETANMIHLKPDGRWLDSPRFQFLKKIAEGKDRYLLPSGHDEFLYEQSGDLRSQAFLSPDPERLSREWDLEFLETMHRHGVTVEQLVTEAGATEEELAALGLLSED